MDGLGFSSTEACQLAGITFRQLDYWTRTKMVEPSVRAAKCSGTHRRWSRSDVVLLAALGHADVFQSMRRPLAEALRGRDLDTPGWIVLDGNWSATYCTTDDELLAALQSSRVCRVIILDTLADFDRVHSSTDLTAVR